VRSDTTPTSCRGVHHVAEVDGLLVHASLARMWSMASPAVISGDRSTYSVVISDPAESSGYLSISFISLRVSGSACDSMRFTRFAGISSTMSTASSMFSSSTICFSSLSLKPASMDFLHLAVHFHEGVGRQLLGQQPEKDEQILNGLVLQQRCDIRRVHCGKHCLNNVEFFLPEKRLQRVEARVAVISAIFHFLRSQVFRLKAGLLRQEQ
jgi:hypothetical protein